MPLSHQLDPGYSGGARKDISVQEGHHNFPVHTIDPGFGLTELRTHSGVAPFSLDTCSALQIIGHFSEPLENGSLGHIWIRESPGPRAGVQYGVARRALVHGPEGQAAGVSQGQLAVLCQSPLAGTLRS